MKYNRELKGWEKFLTRFQIPYIKFVYSRDAFDDWRIEIYRAYWKFRPKNYMMLDEYWAEILESNIRFWERVRCGVSGVSDLDRYDPETGAYLRRGPITNRDLGDEA